MSFKWILNFMKSKFFDKEIIQFSSNIFWSIYTITCNSTKKEYKFMKQ